MTTRTVTVGLPVYRRLQYLPQALRSLEAQDYAQIELIVSDNGSNGSKIPEIVAEHFSRPYRFRQNAETVSIATHFNQLLAEASGEYFVILCDDDEISPNYVSAMVNLLETHPEASVGLARLEVVDESGLVTSSSDARGFPPPALSGEEFVRAWCAGTYDFVCFVTNMARTVLVRRYAGYPDFPTGNSIDNAVMVKLCLDSHVAFSPECVFRYRVYEASEGLSASYQGLAKALRSFMHFLESDPRVLAYALDNPATWARMKDDLVGMTWRTYHNRWASMYRSRLGALQWIRAGLAMPFIPGYYRLVLSTMRRSMHLGAAKNGAQSP